MPSPKHFNPVLFSERDAIFLLSLIVATTGRRHGGFHYLPNPGRTATAFTEATLRVASTINSDLLAVVRGGVDQHWDKQIEGAIALRKATKEALLKHIREHGC
jgi:hypothetical protein